MTYKGKILKYLYIIIKYYVQCRICLWEVKRIFICLHFELFDSDFIDRNYLPTVVRSILSRSNAIATITTTSCRDSRHRLSHSSNIPLTKTIQHNYVPIWLFHFNLFLLIIYYISVKCIRLYYLIFYLDIWIINDILPKIKIITIEIYLKLY